MVWALLLSLYGQYKSKVARLSLLCLDLISIEVARKKGEHKKIFETAKIITIGPNMKEDFLAIYPEFVDKIKFAHFGSARLDIISELYNEKTDKFIEINIKSKKIKL